LECKRATFSPCLGPRSGRPETRRCNRQTPRCRCRRIPTSFRGGRATRPTTSGVRYPPTCWPDNVDDSRVAMRTRPDSLPQTCRQARLAFARLAALLTRRCPPVPGQARQLSREDRLALARLARKQIRWLASSPRPRPRLRAAAIEATELHGIVSSSEALDELSNRAASAPSSEVKAGDRNSGRFEIRVAVTRGGSPHSASSDGRDGLQ